MNIAQRICFDRVSALERSQPYAILHIRIMKLIKFGVAGLGVWRI
jgi:hypothetical protein